MQLGVLFAKRDCNHGSWKKGDLLLVDVDYDWDPQKVIVLSVLTRGSNPGISEYKEALDAAPEDMVYEYLDSDNKGFTP